MALRIGRMNEEVVIQTWAESRTSSGGVIDTWATFATVWAEVSYLKGSEPFDAGRPIALNVRTFRVRWLDGLTEKMRISFDSVFWDIDSIEEVERNTEMLITATKGAEA